MARKKRRDSAADRSGAGSARGTTTATRRKAPSPPPTVKPAPFEPGGPNRPARKEEARRQREALQRKMARRRWYRLGAALLAVAVVAAGIAWFVLTRPDPAAAAGCTAVRTTKPFKGADGTDLDRAHIGSDTGPAVMPPLSQYPSIPPASGPHNPTPLTAGVYDTPPNLDQAIHSLEHGAVIIWYSPTVPDSQLQELRTFVQGDPDHLIMAVYDYPKEGQLGELPAGRSMALVAWHHVQLCNQVSLDVAENFVRDFRVKTNQAPPPGYPKDGAPEPGAPLA